MPEVQVRSELACERLHRVILRSGRNAQARVALASCFRDEPPEQNRADASGGCSSAAPRTASFLM